MMAVGAFRMVERNWLVYQRYWAVFLSGFAEPIVYLFAADLGLDPLVGALAGPGGGLLTYSEFVGPGLLASAAMNGAIIDVTYQMFFKLKYTKTFESVLATPLAISAALLGEILWSQIRGGLYSAVFLGILVVAGLVSSAWAVLILPAAILIGFTFAAVGAAATTYVRHWGDLDYVQLVLVPLFLFSTGFFPLSVYPGWAQPIVQVTPLYHGITLVRSLSVGVVGPTLLVHVAYLAVLGGVALRLVQRRFALILVK